MPNTREPILYEINSRPQAGLKHVYPSRNVTDIGEALAEDELRNTVNIMPYKTRSCVQCEEDTSRLYRTGQLLAVESS